MTNLLFSKGLIIPLAASITIIGSSNANAQDVRYSGLQTNAHQQQYAAAYIPPQQQRFDAPAYNAAPKKSDWNFAAGAGVIYSPTYEGSDNYRIIPIPAISADYKDGLFFANVWDGVGSYPIQGQNYKLGGAIGLDLGRDESDDRKNLRGMGDIDMSPTANLMGEYGFGSLKLSGKVTTGNDEYGTTATAKLGTMHPVSNELVLLASAGTTWADEEHMESRFGVSPGQAALSGYGAYQAESGIKSVGLTVGAVYAATPKIDVQFMAKADQLLGDAADSPLTKSEFQPSAILTTSYKF